MHGTVVAFLATRIRDILLRREAEIDKRVCKAVGPAESDYYAARRGGVG